MKKRYNQWQELSSIVKTVVWKMKPVITLEVTDSSPNFSVRRDFFYQHWPDSALKVKAECAKQMVKNFFKKGQNFIYWGIERHKGYLSNNVRSVSCPVFQDAQ